MYLSNYHIARDLSDVLRLIFWLPVTLHPIGLLRRRLKILLCPLLEQAKMKESTQASNIH